MRRVVIIAAIVVGAAIAFNLGRNVPAEEVPPPPVAEPSDGAELGGGVAAPPALAERRRLAALRSIAGQGTYLGATLVESDSVLRRWVDREERPLLVYFEPATVRGYTAIMGRRVREAFTRWRRVGGIPVQFEFLRTPDRADVTVRWIESFPVRRAGQADLVWRGDGHLQRATLTLATHSHLGQPLGVDAVATVALHEIGHLLGLGHSDQPRDVMYPTTSVHDLTSRDRRTAMLLYSLPAGSLKGPSRR